MSRRILLWLLGGLILSAGALYLAFRNVPLADLGGYLAEINYLWILPASVIILAAFALRALRWRMILADTAVVSFPSAFHPMIIGFMLNCVLPGRVGEVIRPAIIHRRDGVPFSGALATVAAERVFDAIVLIFLLAVVLATVTIDPDLDVTFGGYHLNRDVLESMGRRMGLLCAILVAGIGMLIFRRSRGWIHSAIGTLPALFGFASSAFRDKVTRLADWLSRAIDGFAGGFAMMGRPGGIFACIGLSVVIWLLHGLSYWIFTFGAPGVTMTFAEMTAVMVIICFFIALPSVPGYWGLWEAGGVFAMTLFGIPEKEAAGFTLANHAIQMIPVIIFGILSALYVGIRSVRLAAQTAEEHSGAIGG